MGKKKGIEWCDSTWSPIRAQVKKDAARIAQAKGYTSLVEIADRMAGRVGQHCEHVSPGCEHCFAETNNHRCLPANGTGLPYDRRSRDLIEAFMDEKALSWPMKCGTMPNYTREGVRTEDRPRHIFVESQSDLFGEWVTDEMLDQVFAAMALCPQHIFQVLTKRPERRLDYLRAAERRVGEMTFVNALRGYSLGKVDPESIRDPQNRQWPLPNVWQGVSVENQQIADERIEPLLRTPAAARFISIEPMLGPINLGWIGCECDTADAWDGAIDALHGKTWIEKWNNADGSERTRVECQTIPKLDWVICGGESGHGARPMHPDWARGLRDQRKAAGVPFFMKQWGEWEPQNQSPGDTGFGSSIMHWGSEYSNSDCRVSFKVGKHKSGALLDGVEHKYFPEVSR